MKTSINKLIAACGIAMLMLAACKKDGAIVQTNGGVSGALTASVSTLVLSKASLTDTTQVIKFTFTQPAYGFSAAVTNTLQIDAAGDNWVNPRSVNLATNVLKAGYSTADFNNLLLKLNLPTGKASAVSVRIMSTVSGSVAPVYSNIATVTATPFALVSFMYVPGAYQGWNFNSEDSLISATGNGVYTGIINFTSGNLQFKITTLKSWNSPSIAYGMNSTNTAPMAGGPNNLAAPAAGLTWVTLDVNAMTITYTPVTKYYSLVGSATAVGWNGDVDMKYVNGTQTWNVVAPLTAPGTGGNAFKIRMNHDWGTSYGFVKPADGMTLTSAGGDNMTVSASGNYQVTFQLNTADVSGLTAFYTVIKQ